MSTSPEPRAVLRDPVHLVAFGFGLGLAPWAPGTFGTLLGVALHLLTVDLPLTWRVTGITLAFVLGVWVCGESARRLGAPDHGGIVWDEVVGVLIALVVVPPGWVGVVAGFLLFRLLDIWKPWPIRLADRRVHGGFGIMLDDALAGAGAAVMLGLAYHYGVL